MIGNADCDLRLAAFDWLTELKGDHGDLLPWAVLKQGFAFRGDRIHVLGPQGIFKPRRFELPLSITTSPQSLYSDRFDPSAGVLRYSYRGSNPRHPDNVGLRRAMSERVPLVYFHGIEPGSYLATYPVFVVGDNPEALVFAVQADDVSAIAIDEASYSSVAEDPEPRRAYVTATVRRRLHQLAFRERVVKAYRERCALCRLGHRELLDAAHITRDADPDGEPVISNGLALCKLHHAAFDGFFFAVTPAYRVEVRRSILDESDGQMLIVGLQQIHGQQIHLPARVVQYPDRDRLARRYEEFKQAS